MTEERAGGALVIGGASGLGAASARALSASGRAVTVADRDTEAAQRLAEQLGPSARAVAVDVTEDAEVGAAFDAAAAEAPLEAVVCSAGIGWAERLAGRDGVHEAESFARVVGVNLIGSFHVLRHAARVLSAQTPAADGQRGVVVLTGSIAAQDGQAGQIAYAASKAGVAGMSLPAARDLAPHGVRVCTIEPGTFETPLLAGLPAPARAQLAESVPWPPRLGHPEEYASLVLEIVRNRMLNGAVLRLDGALRMPFRTPSERRRPPTAPEAER
jgi:NAD(P)-dependent dehydrogenase (short-subunit alcohol dehydrogenase family)